MADIGYGKSIAAGLAGAVTTIGVYVIEQWSGHTLPTEITTAIQTVITAAAVFWTPHTLTGPAQPVAKTT